MVFQKRADLIVTHQFARTQAGKIAMKRLETQKQRIRCDIDLHRKTLPMQPAEAAEPKRRFAFWS